MWSPCQNSPSFGDSASFCKRCGGHFRNFRVERKCSSRKATVGRALTRLYSVWASKPHNWQMPFSSSRRRRRTPTPAWTEYCSQHSCEQNDGAVARCCPLVPLAALFVGFLTTVGACACFVGLPGVVAGCTHGKGASGCRQKRHMPASGPSVPPGFSCLLLLPPSLLPLPLVLAFCCAAGHRSAAEGVLALGPETRPADELDSRRRLVPAGRWWKEASGAAPPAPPPPSSSLSRPLPLVWLRRRLLPPFPPSLASLPCSLLPASLCRRRCFVLLPTEVQLPSSSDSEENSSITSSLDKQAKGSCLGVSALFVHMANNDDVPGSTFSVSVEAEPGVVRPRGTFEKRTVLCALADRWRLTSSRPARTLGIKRLLRARWSTALIALHCRRKETTDWWATSSQKGAERLDKSSAGRLPESQQTVKSETAQRYLLKIAEVRV
eukprot:m.269382 g.269382  ORF g.269382 m.269382 type:complete len:437 (-) comp19302_c0_seq3:84-1394(-)